MDADTWVHPPELWTARITGWCVCGAVRWSYDEPFSAMLYCHCSICREAAAQSNSRLHPLRFQRVGPIS